MHVTKINEYLLYEIYMELPGSLFMKLCYHQVALYLIFVRRQYLKAIVRFHQTIRSTFHGQSDIINPCTADFFIP